MRRLFNFDLQTEYIDYLTTKRGLVAIPSQVSVTNKVRHQTEENFEQTARQYQTLYYDNQKNQNLTCEDFYKNFETENTFVKHKLLIFREMKNSDISNFIL